MAATIDALRPRLLDAEEAAGLDVHGRIDAAVLVPLYVQDGALHSVFTRRRDDLRRHAGEISFPGGRQDIEEGEEDLRDTALREAEEEIGLPRDAVDIVGALTPTPTIATNYAVYPFVGVIEPGHRWQPSAAEVAEVLELSVPDLRAVIQDPLWSGPPSRAAFFARAFSLNPKQRPASARALAAEYTAAVIPEA